MPASAVTDDTLANPRRQQPIARKVIAVVLLVLVFVAGAAATITYLKDRVNALSTVSSIGQGDTK